MNVLDPLTTKWSPSRTAVVRRCPTSEPPPGSVMASEPMSSPRRVGGRTHFSICSGSPAAARCGSAIPDVNREANAPPDAPAWWNSSQISTASTRSPPSPPDGFGETGAEQTQLGGLPVQRAGQFAVAFPLVQVRQYLSFDEAAHRLAQFLPLG